MSVKLKTLLIAVLSFAFIMTSVFIAFNYVVVGYIERVENNDINKSFDEVSSILDREKTGMVKEILDWSVWDDTYNFISGKNVKFYIDNNLQSNTLEKLSLNFMIFTDSKGHISYHLYKSDIRDETKILLTDLINDNRKLTEFDDNSDVHSGIMNISGKLYIIIASPVTTSDGMAASDGSLIIGRSINDDALFKYIDSITGCNVNIAPLPGPAKKENSIVKSSNFISAYKLFKDFDGNDNIIVYVSMLRDKYILGLSYLRIFLIINLILAIFTVFIAIFIFDGFILKRLSYVNGFIDEVSVTKETSLRLSATGHDEITNISKSINNMMSALDLANKDILDMSYTDDLTGLKNRNYVKKKFEEISSKDCNYSIIFGNINGLKIVNDTLGHKDGDRLISAFGNVLKEQCMEDDIVARWGGDEFAAIIINKAPAYVSDLMCRIEGQCRNIDDFDFDLSIALGSAEKSEANSIEEVLNLAEKRMFRSKLTDKKSSRNATILSLENALYERHSETEEHTERVKRLSLMLGEKFNLTQDKLNELELVGILHDIGKIGIPDSILLKPGKLTNEEWEIMKKHTEIGYRIAKATPDLAHVAKEILSHHERFDGKGYPEGLKGDEIPLLSRIINIVDSFDVMTHNRVYKEAFDIEYAKEEIKICSGTQFDPAVAEKFLELLEETH